MLRLHCIKNGENFRVLCKIRKTVGKLYFWKTFYFWQMTPAFFGSITIMTHEKEFYPSLWKIVIIHLEAEILFLQTVHLEVVRGNPLSCVAQTQILAAHRMRTTYIQFRLQFCRIRKETTYYCLSPKIINVTFEAAVTNSINSVFSLPYYWL